MKKQKIKTIKINNKAYNALKILKKHLEKKTYSEAIICTIHTAITNIYLYDMAPGDKEPKVIKELEKAIKWRRPKI